MVAVRSERRTVVAPPGASNRVRGLVNGDANVVCFTVTYVEMPSLLWVESCFFVRESCVILRFVLQNRLSNFRNKSKESLVRLKFYRCAESTAAVHVTCRATKCIAQKKRRQDISIPPHEVS